MTCFDFMPGGMMIVMAVVWIMVIAVVALEIAALIKYLRSK